MIENKLVFNYKRLLNIDTTKQNILKYILHLSYKSSKSQNYKLLNVFKRFLTHLIHLIFKF